MNENHRIFQSLFQKVVKRLAFSLLSEIVVWQPGRPVAPTGASVTASVKGLIPTRIHPAIQEGELC